MDIDNEKRIRQIVNEELRKLLLQEYAYERSDFMDRVYGISRQIAIHWCLIRFSQLTNYNVEYIPHWKKELRAWMFSICEMEIKKNNSFKTRYKAIYETWDKMDYISKPQVIWKVIYGKFIDEGINMKTKEVEQITTEFVENSKILIEMMANADMEKINDYIYDF